MRSLIALAAGFGLAGCASMPGPGATSPICEVARPDKFVGQAATSEIGAAILAETRSSLLRWLTPGMMVTMEFNAKRVTVRLGPDGKILAVNCG